MGLFQRSIMNAVHCASKTIKNVFANAEYLEITYEGISEMSDAEVDELFSERKEVPRYAEMPDYEYVHKEPAREYVTQMLLCEEYREDCINKELNYYKYTQFCDKYKDHVTKKQSNNTYNHKAR